MKKIFVALSLTLVLSAIFIGCGKKEVINTMSKINDKQSQVQPAQTNESTGNQLVTTPKDLFNYLNLTQEQLVATLGENYKKEEYTCESGVRTVLNYEGIGISAVFSKGDPKFEKPIEIWCSNKVNINGASSGMNFKQVQEKLGNANIKMSPMSDYEEGGVGIYYKMRYRVNDIAIIFESAEKDGETSLKITKHELVIAQIEAEKVLGITAENEIASAFWETEINGKEYYPVKIMKIINQTVEDKDDQTYYVDAETYKVYQSDKSNNMILLNK